MAIPSPNEDNKFDTSALAEYVTSMMHWKNNIVQRTIKRLRTLDINDDDFKKNLEKYVEALQTARLCAEALTEAADNFFTYADLDQSQEDEINLFYKDGNYRNIEIFFDQMKEYLQCIQEVHTKFKEIFNSVKLSCVTESINEEIPLKTNKFVAVLGSLIFALVMFRYKFIKPSLLIGTNTTYGNTAYTTAGNTSSTAAGTSTTREELNKVMKEIAEDFTDLNSLISYVGSNIEEIIQQLTHIVDHMFEANDTFQFSKAFHNIQNGIRKGHDIVKRHKQEESGIISLLIIKHACNSLPMSSVCPAWPHPLS